MEFLNRKEMHIVELIEWIYYKTGRLEDVTAGNWSNNLWCADDVMLLGDDKTDYVNLIMKAKIENEKNGINVKYFKNGSIIQHP